MRRHWEVLIGLVLHPKNVNSRLIDEYGVILNNEVCYLHSSKCYPHFKASSCELNARQGVDETD